MKKIGVFSSISRVNSHPKGLFKGKDRRFFLTACVMASVFVLLVFPQNDIPHQQKVFQRKSVTAYQKATITREFDLKRGGREVISIEVETAGKIEARAEWSGTTQSLALLLNGPGQTQTYAREYGGSPLSLTFNVTSRLLSLGKTWKVSVVNFSSRASARGKVQITYPGVRESVPQIKPKEKAIEKPVIKPIEKKKFIKVKYYEIQESQGLTAQQLEEIKIKLKEQRIEHAKAKIEKRLKEIAPKNPLAPIVVPLIYKRIEEKSQRRLMIRRINTSPHFQTMVQAYKNISPSVKRQYLHPRYAQLKAGQRIDKLQLGKDILNAVHPDYKNKIRQIVRKAFSPDSPKFQWKTARVQRIEPRKPARLQLKLSQSQIKKLDTLTSRLKIGPSQANMRELKEFVKAQRFSLADVSNNQLHRVVTDELQVNVDWVPDINDDHSVRNYYKYDIGLDWFYCVDQNERTCVSIPFWGRVCSDDEPYWYLSATVPRFDPDDPDQMHRLHEGQLYSVFSRITGTYEDVNNGETRVFRSQDRWLINQNTYSTSTTFSIDLWEEDFSKAAVRDAIQDAFEELKDELIDVIKEAVLDTVKDALYESLKEALPDELKAVLTLFFEGELSFSSLMETMQMVAGGIDIGMIALELIFSGKSITDIIAGLGGACPEITIALMAIKVAGPIVIDLFQGDFQDAFRGLLYLPLSLFESIIDFFTDIIDFFENLLAIIDPDDHIQTRSITIKGSFDDIFQDASWGDYYSSASVGGIPSGSGPTSGNSSLIRGNRYVQPVLRFEGADAKYRVYYNVKRTLVGGRETFGYTVKASPDPTWSQTRTYFAKSRSYNKKIKVSYCVLNADGDPLIVLSKIGGGVSGTNLGTTGSVFYVDVVPGAEYELTIINLFGKGDLYGYVTLEEK